MEERKQRSGEDRRQSLERRKVTDRREFNLLLYKLLIFDSPDKRSASDRRRGGQERGKTKKD